MTTTTTIIYVTLDNNFSFLFSFYVCYCYTLTSFFFRRDIKAIHWLLKHNMDPDLEKWNILFSCIDGKIKKSKDLMEQFALRTEEASITNTKLIQKFEEHRNIAEDRLKSKQNEMKVMFQTRFKSLQSQKSDEEEKLKQETMVLEEITNKMQQAVNKKKNLKEEKLIVAKKELSKRDQATLELFIHTFQLYWVGDFADDEVKGFFKLKGDVVPFHYKKHDICRKEIVEKMWDIMEV